MVDFKPFSKLIRAKFNSFSQRELFVVDIDGDVLWEKYLGAFPEGTNPMFRTRREYDCSCCKNFIRNIANVVAIVDNQLVSVWDIEGAEYPFNVVSEVLANEVKNGSVNGVFRTKESTYGNETTRELSEGGVVNWNHFAANISGTHICQEVGEIKGKKATFAQVLRRGLDELSYSAVQTVLDLINDDMLYRGTEHLASVKGFKTLQDEYRKLNSDQARNNFVWANVANAAAGFRNTVIGTLVEDLTDGVDLEAAVAKFESKVAPGNYKRSKSLITPAMIKDAMKTITDLGLEPALERRFAKISDVTVNNVLFVDNSVRAAMKGGLEGLLMSAAAPKKVTEAKAENISIDEFIADIVPKSSEIAVQVKNAHQGNFMSLTAPVHDEVEQLFKWDNNFAWSYAGNITDSDIKQKVKAAGGNVTNAKLRVSLAWYNYDDLDIHVREPNGTLIYYGNKLNKLDVDMNAGGRSSRVPVENVSWTSVQDGVYNVIVNNFARRESIDVGFALEVESGGALHTYKYEKSVGANVKALDLVVQNGLVVDVKMHPGVTGGSFSADVWGVKTETFVPVDSIILSPNYWDENATGNKHWFFILKGCLNNEPVRGIYNEFLKPGLEKHRKVFEILGDKTKAEPTPDQLSGVGFSSTKRETLLVQVKGDKINKTYNVQF